jgi:hypothetical protein
MGANYAGASGGSDASHIVGPMSKRFGAGENYTTAAQGFRFPVGKGNVLREIGVYQFNNFSAGSEFSAEYFSGGTPNLLSTNAPINHVSKLEYWDLSRTNGTSEPRVVLTWNLASDVGNSGTWIDELLVAHRSAPGYNSWFSEGQGFATGTHSSGYVVSANNISSFSFFTLASTTTNNPLPVTMLKYSATYNEDTKRAELKWTTASESNCAGFTVSRAVGNTNNFVKIDSYETNPQLNCKGGSINNYLFTDDDLVAGNIYYYLLEQIDADGKTTKYEVKAVKVGTDETTLYQNTPNPFGYSTTIPFFVGKEGKVKIEIIDMLGRVVATVADGEYGVGYHEVTFNATSLQSGTYIVRMITEDKQLVKKMSLEK